MADEIFRLEYKKEGVFSSGWIGLNGHRTLFTAKRGYPNTYDDPKLEPHSSKILGQYLFGCKGIHGFTKWFMQNDKLVNNILKDRSVKIVMYYAQDYIVGSKQVVFNPEAGYIKYTLDKKALLKENYIKITKVEEK